MRNGSGPVVDEQRSTHLRLCHEYMRSFARSFTREDQSTLCGTVEKRDLTHVRGWAALRSSGMRYFYTCDTWHTVGRFAKLSSFLIVYSIIINNL